MALTETETSVTGSSESSLAGHRPKIWVVQYGPCWCRAEPGGVGSFDFVRFRTAEIEPDTLDRDMVIVSDRVIIGSGQILRQIHDEVPHPNLVVATGHCPAARDFWDELPEGWAPVEEVLSVDVRIDQCFSGYPEILLAAVLEHLRRATPEKTTSAEFCRGMTRQ